jgi:hypothetical protein
MSGHAPAGELLYVLNLVRPRNFMPVRGDWRATCALTVGEVWAHMTACLVFSASGPNSRAAGTTRSLSCEIGASQKGRKHPATGLDPTPAKNRRRTMQLKGKQSKLTARQQTRDH